MSETMIRGWMMTEVGQPVVQEEFAAPALAPGEVLVEVAGCGVCHTDISFLHMGVKTRGGLPLVLGHEVSGYVRDAGEGVDTGIIDQPVLVPAVLPCGECPSCKAGHRTICAKQIMPGNDRHGGYASHMVVPARWVCPVSDAVLQTHDLWELAVVSDAVTTPFMAVKRSGLEKGDFAVVIGSGGIGIHAVQIAAATGAHVAALDVDDGKLEQARGAGAETVVNVGEISGRDLKKHLRGEAKRLGAPPVRWRVYETSGTKPGQETAFSLLNHGAYGAIIGFTMAKLEVRLSNLMAFDATLRGNWGCDPALYPEVLDWIADGRLKVGPYVERHPLDDINAVLDLAHAGKLQKRAVLVP